MEKNLNNHLKCISKGKKIILDPTDGKKTISRAKKIFTGSIGLYFDRWGLDVPDAPTEQTEVQIYKTIEEGTFKDLFSNFGKDHSCFCLKQSQIVQFCERHLDWLNGGSGLFFLFNTNLNFFVAQAYQDHGNLYADVHHLLHERIWHPDERLRIIVPRF
jgi:hypothetical protein